MQKIFFTILPLLLLLISVGGYAQAPASVDGRTLMEKFTVFEPNTYILPNKGFGNVEKLVYEVGFAPQFRIAANKYPEWGFLFTPHFIFRMLNQYSHPIRTPSYMPKGTLFYHVGYDQAKGTDRFAFLTVGHHSNGQEGSFFESDSVTLNIYDGSFSSNYAMIGYEWVNENRKTFNPVSDFRLSTSFHFVNKIIRQMYGPLRFYADLQSTLYLTGEKPNFFSPKNSRAALTGRMNVAWLAMGLGDAAPFDIKRLMFNYTLSYQPSFINDVALFTRFYYGQDYYNIRFERTLTVWQFGFSFKNLSFK